MAASPKEFTVTIARRHFKVPSGFGALFPVQTNFGDGVTLLDTQSNLILPKDNQGRVEVAESGNYRLFDLTTLLESKSGKGGSGGGSGGGARSGFVVYMRDHKGEGRIPELAKKWKTLSQAEKDSYNARVQEAKAEPDADQPKPAKIRKVVPKTEAPLVGASSSSAAGAPLASPQKQKVVKVATQAPAGSGATATSTQKPVQAKPAVPKSASQPTGGAPVGSGAPKLPKKPSQPAFGADSQ